LFVRVKRPLIGDSIELPAGYIEQGEQPLVALIREVYEETGLNVHLKDVQHVTTYYPALGYSKQKMHMYLVLIPDLKEKLKYTANPKDKEVAGLHLMTYNIFRNRIKNNKYIKGGKETIAFLAITNITKRYKVL
jgi:8-oxo-dGTP pyrophosphatase MutT (NUDIX family)